MRIFTAVLLAAWVALPSWAQETSRGNEFAVYLGAGHVGGKEGTYGKGTEDGLSIEIRRFSSIGFMADVNRLTHSGSISNVNGTGDHWDIAGTVVHGSGSIVYHFREAPFEPYVFGGAGALRSSREIRITGDFRVFAGPVCFAGCNPNIQPTRFEQVTVKETKPAFHAGAGIRVPLAWRLSFRPEIRLLQAGDVRLVQGVFALSYRW